MAKRNLQELPKFRDRWSHLYIEHGSVERKDASIILWDISGVTKLPIDQLAFLMLGPGTKITHAAIKLLADNNCLVCWVGEQGVRLYAHSTGGTHSSHRMLLQAKLWANTESRMQVVMRMYNRRFKEPLPNDATVEIARAMEGARVRNAYKELSRKYGVEWIGRSYSQSDWKYSDPCNRALSTANACLYGICHAAIVSAGYSPAIGFVHTGKMLSFVYDIADLYKMEIAIPAAFSAVSKGTEDLERRVRIACRDTFHESKIMKRILPDIAEVLDASDTLGESPGELEGRAVSMADRAAERCLLGESNDSDKREIMDEDT